MEPLKLRLREIFNRPAVWLIPLGIWLSLVIALRPYQVDRSGMLYGGDDRSFFAYTTSIVFGAYPVMTREFVDEFNPPPLARSGVGWQMVPLAFLGSLVDRYTSSKIVDVRNAETVQSSWTLVGAVATSMLMLWLSCFFLLKTARLFADERSAAWATFFMVMTQGVVLYAFRRPIFSHIYELCWNAAAVYLLVSKRIHSSRAWTSLFFFWLSLFGVVSSRQTGLANAAVYSFIWFLDGSSLIPSAHGSHLHGLKNWLMKISMSGIFFISVAGMHWFLKGLPERIYPEAFAASNALFESTSFLSDLKPWVSVIYRPFHILFYPDWGLVFTAPFLLLGVFQLLFGVQKKGMTVLRSSSVILVMSFFFLILWRSQGSWYGYRYFLFPAIPLLAPSFAMLVQRWRGLWGERRSLILLFALAVPPTVSWMAFESTPRTDLSGVLNEYGERRWTNMRYQVEAWSYMIDPRNLVKMVSRGPLPFLVGQSIRRTTYSNLLPAKFFEIYPSDSLNTLLKVLFYLLWNGLLTLVWVRYCSEKQVR